MVRRKKHDRGTNITTVDFAGIVNSVQSADIENDYDIDIESSSSSSITMTDQEEPKTPVSGIGSTKMRIDGAPPAPVLLSSPKRVPSPPSPGRVRRADCSKMGRSINRPVEEKPLLDEIREVLAQSYMMFLLADLRFMSGTGRIGTKYEYLAIDSDNCKRDTANRIACLSDNVKDDDVKQIGHYKGLSHAVIMAMLILEIRDQAVKTAEDKKKSWKKGDKKIQYTTSVDIDNDDQFIAYTQNEEKQRVVEESMESLMRTYSRMISEDLVTEIPNIKRRRATVHQNKNGMMSGNLLSPSGANTSNNSSFGSSIGSSKSTFNRFSFARATNGGGGSGEVGPPSKAYFPSPVPAKVIRGALVSVEEDKPSVEGFEVETLGSDRSVIHNIDENDGGSDSMGTDSPVVTFQIDEESEKNEGSSRSSRQLFSPNIRAHVKKRAENSMQFVDRIKIDFNQQVDNVLPTNHEANTQKEFQELTDVFFDQGSVNEDIKSGLGSTYSREEMVEVMRKAVENRDDDRLQFLSSMFKKGSVSKLMAESHARVVWVNDWYPIQELTYAISVDALQRRVMVVFRGAITQQDWKSAFNFHFCKIRNPIEDDYDGKKKTLQAFSGLYIYLFRKRKDTGTTKYDEIANMVHKYGVDRIGDDYKLFVTGHSLGGALTHFFAFFASADERFTKNGPVKAIAFASPYIGGHSFADAIRHQERMHRLQMIQCRNGDDAIPRLPPNIKMGRRGPCWRHIGIGVTLPKLPKCGMKWKPMVHYWGKEKNLLESCIHGYRRNILFHIAYLKPWTMDRNHKLFELQDRLMYGELTSEVGEGFALLQSTVDELYERLEENDFETLSKTKSWGTLQRLKGKAGLKLQDIGGKLSKREIDPKP